jgi:hypothetical protein
LRLKASFTSPNAQPVREVKSGDVVAARRGRLGGREGTKTREFRLPYRRKARAIIA